MLNIVVSAVAKYRMKLGLPGFSCVSRQRWTSVGNNLANKMVPLGRFPAGSIYCLPYDGGSAVALKNIMPAG